jgi:hypothetical protein
METGISLFIYTHLWYIETTVSVPEYAASGKA